MKLSEDLRKWRSERPDEWTMDRFIREAEKLEAFMEKGGPTACSCGSNDVKYDYRDEITVCQSCGTYW